MPKGRDGTAAGSCRSHVPLRGRKKKKRGEENRLPTCIVDRKMGIWRRRFFQQRKEEGGGGVSSSRPFSDPYALGGEKGGERPFRLRHLSRGGIGRRGRDVAVTSSGRTSIEGRKGEGEKEKDLLGSYYKRALGKRQLEGEKKGGKEGKARWRVVHLGAISDTKKREKGNACR